MHVEQLAAQQFRNLEPLRVSFTTKPVVIVGENGQGKTNLLEALAVCTTGRSFRNAGPRELLRHDAEAAHLKATLVRHDVRHDVEVDIDARHRFLRIDGRGVRQSTQLLQIVNIVSFFPDDLRIAKGSPEERRRFLDRAVSNHRPDFVEAALAYAAALKARNAVLRGKTRPDRTLLEVYDAQLIRHGAVLHQCRRETLEALTPLAENHFARLMGDALPISLALAHGLGSAATPEIRAVEEEASPSAFSAAFSAALNRHHAADCARGITSVGPHRADLHIELGGQVARLYASQGQQRAVVLALKLAELEYLHARIGSPPILLLDDVSSELDKERTAHLFDALASLASQVWVTTTGTAPLPLPADSQIFSMKSGKLEPFAGSLNARF